MNINLLNVFKQKLFFVSFLPSLLICIFIYESLYQFKFVNDHVNIFIISLIFLFSTISFIFFIFLKNIFLIVNQIKLEKAGQELQKKILFIFSAIALTPTLFTAFGAGRRSTSGDCRSHRSTGAPGCR